ncbi:hypothetical protein M9H77_26944 [Catharanthus roseus]|uniref:Uncharacterized protein n=1 Tax=Catharanthus roseus TaxID=4058 RepID=A0ACC0ABL6_CATRO|nr:hypothetical protein M9H77_26944 [Catharanthus roseus]
MTLDISGIFGLENRGFKLGSLDKMSTLNRNDLILQSNRMLYGSDTDRSINDLSFMAHVRYLLHNISLTMKHPKQHLSYACLITHILTTIGISLHGKKNISGIQGHRDDIDSVVQQVEVDNNETYAGSGRRLR